MGSVCVWIVQVNIVKCSTNKVKGVHLSVCLRLTSPLRLLQGESIESPTPATRTHARDPRRAQASLTTGLLSD